jgi:Autotransporter beta-domain
VKFPVAASRKDIVATLAIAGLAGISATPGKADTVIEQEIVRNAVQNILWTVRDQIQNRRLTAPAPGMMRFTGEESEFDNRRPFEQSARDAFDALGYAKAPAMAPAAVPVWLYGVNAIGAVDETRTAGVGTTAASGTGAFDVTKIGIFTASDALTFVTTGTGIWAHTFGLDITTSSGAGTLAYTNGGFSADFTTSATWSRLSAVVAGVIAPPNSSSVSYAGNAQYKFDLPNKFYIEPTIGLTYTELYTANFGTKTGDATELHGGARVGTEFKWMSYTLQPQVSGAVFQNVSQNGALAGAVPGLPGAAAGASTSGVGGRGSARINVIWTPNFSSFLDVHGTAVAATTTAPVTQTIGGSAGMRYSW